MAKDEKDFATEELDFEGGKAGGEDRATSAGAAATVDTAKYRKQILDEMEKDPDRSWIIDELSDALCLDRQTLSPRMSELEERGKVHRVITGYRDDGREIPRRRKGNAGKGQQEWFLGPSPMPRPPKRVKQKIERVSDDWRGYGVQVA